MEEPRAPESYPIPGAYEISTLWGGKSVGDAQTPVDAYYYFRYHKMSAGFGRIANYGVLDTNHVTYSNHLDISNSSGVVLRMASGVAVVGYHLYLNDANVDHSLTTRGYYRLVLRAASSTQTVRAVILGPSTVDWPTYLQTYENYDLPLCRAHSTGATLDILYDDRRFMRNLSLPRRQGSADANDWQAAGSVAHVLNDVMTQCGSGVAGTTANYGKSMGGTVGHKALVFTSPKAYTVDPTTENIVVTDSAVTHFHYTTVGGITNLESVMWIAFWNL
jgi:hypothetical protein